MLLDIYTNRNSKKDFVQNAFNQLGSKAENIYIAVAFFTDFKAIEALLSKGCRVRIVVRLGFPTNPDALETLLRSDAVEARYFTSSSFHPKLFIFGDREALVGSANLTKAALTSNQEIMVKISSEDEVFQGLASLFSEYWEEAKVLSPEAIEKYRQAYNKYRNIQVDVARLEDEVDDKVGKAEFSNINRGRKKRSKENIFLDDYKKTYQECVSAFNEVRKVYDAVGRRKVSEELIPLRVEIDSFISYAREKHAQKDIWRQTRVTHGMEQAELIKSCIDEWHDTPWPHFEDIIVHETYPRLKKVFAKQDNILNASDEALFKALTTLHSLLERRRYYPGGLPSLREDLFKKNDSKHIRDSLVYLVFGKDDVVKRMVNLIYDADYKINCFGRSNVQELVGWCNTEELPVINSRTTKVLKYFGFDVRQLSDK